MTKWKIGAVVSLGLVGTDTQNLAVRMMYLASAAAVAIMTDARAAVRHNLSQPGSAA